MWWPPKTLRKLDPAATVTLIGGEQEPLYSRMAIPYLLRGDIDESGTYLRRKNVKDYFAATGIRPMFGSAQSVDAAAKQVNLADGASGRGAMCASTRKN